MSNGATPIVVAQHPPGCDPERALSAVISTPMNAKRWETRRSMLLFATEDGRRSRGDKVEASADP